MDDFLIFFWLKQPFIIDYEFEAYKDIYSLKSIFFKPDKSTIDFLYIDTSKNLEIETQDRLEIARTDRKELLKALDLLYQNKDKYKLILLDIVFDRLQPKDSAISSQLQQRIDALSRSGKIVLTDKIIYGEVVPNPFKSNVHGVAFYDKSMDDAFYRFVLTRKINSNTYKQTPLLCHEIMHAKNASPSFFCDIIYRYGRNGGLYQNIFVPEFALSYADIHSGDSGIGNQDSQTVVNANLYYLDLFNSNYDDALSDHHQAVVIIGNFENDIHYTTVGRLPGSIILANIILSLENNVNKISILYLLFLIVSFSLVSYLTFYFLPFEEEYLARFKKKNYYFVVSFVVERANYFALFIATLVGIIFFNCYLFILFTVTYLYILKKITKWYYKKKLV